MELLTISDSLSAQQALEYGALQLVAAEVPPGLLAAPIAQGERLLLCRLLLDATWHSPAASIAARLEAFNTRGSTSEHKLLARTFELSELISSYFPDHFIIPTNSWMWRLNLSTPIVIPPTARHMPNSHALEEAAVPLGFSAEEYNGVLLASFAAGPISFPALVEFVAVLRALGAQLAHGARALLFNVPAGACALQLPPGAPSELQALWASALDELVELSHSYLTCAVLQGALSPPAVELALACRSRVALGGGAPALALSLGAWRDNSKRLPSARQRRRCTKPSASRAPCCSVLARRRPTSSTHSHRWTRGLCIAHCTLHTHNSCGTRHAIDVAHMQNMYLHLHMQMHICTCVLAFAHALAHMHVHVHAHT